ncbi:MAG: ABC transporter permease [Acidobacteriota bacterium]
MRLLERFRNRLRSLFHKHRLERELQDELQFHLESAAKEKQLAGATADQARSEAKAEFGSQFQITEQVRDAWGWRSFEALRQDLRYTARSFGQHPGFFASATLILALAIGSNTAMVSVVRTVLLDALPYPDSSRLVMIWQANPQGADDGVGIAPQDFTKLQATFTSASHLATYIGNDRVVSGTNEPYDASTAFVTANFFEMLGVRPPIGRSFNSEDATAAAAPVTILSHSFWQQALGADPGVIGKKLNIGGQPHTVIGVMGREFTFPEIYGSGPDFDLWTPMSPQLISRIAGGPGDMNLFARLSPGVPFETAQAELRTIGSRFAAERPDVYLGRSLAAVPLQEQVVGNVRPLLAILWGAVLSILLIACASLCNLLLARANGRSKELAMRASLGAGRWRLIRQLLTENAALATCGGVLGWALPWGLIRLLPGLNFAEIPRLDALDLDLSVVAVAALLSLLAGLLFGTVPAISISAIGTEQSVRRTGTGVRRRSALLRGGLVVAQVSIALLLLAGAGLLARSYQSLVRTGPGFQTANRLTFELVLPRATYRNGQAPAYFDRLRTELRQLPQVEDVGTISALPLSGARASWKYRIEDHPIPPADELPTAEFRAVTPGFFGVTQAPLISGRDFDGRDTADSQRVGIVNETFARLNWPGEDPLGKRFERSGWGWATVVGVAPDMHFHRVDQPALPMFYEPLTQGRDTTMSVVIRTNGNPLSLAGASRRIVQSTEPGALMLNLQTMDEMTSNALGPRRAVLAVFGGFAAFALILAALGIYSVVAYTVSQRTSEIGVRLALGAQPTSILAMVVKESGLLTLIGLCLGLVGAFGGSSFMISLLYGIGPTDWVTIVGACAVLLLVSVLAACVPARRVLRIDPLIALRSE